MLAGHGPQITLLMCCWIPFTSIWLRIFASRFLKAIFLIVSLSGLYFSYSAFVWFSYQGNAGFIEWVRKSLLHADVLEKFEGWLLSGVLSFHLVGRPGAFLARQVWWSWTRSASVYLGMSYFLSHFWRTVLPDDSWLTVSLSTLDISASKVPVEKPAHNLIRNPLDVMIHVSIIENLIILCVTVWVSSDSPYLQFLELLGCLHWCISSYLGSFQPSFFPNVLSLPPFLSLLLLGLPQRVLVRLMVSSGPTDCSLFFTLFSFCFSVMIMSIVLPSSVLILSSACSNLPLIPL